MARGTELRTDFTGDDSRFSKVVDRQKAKAGEFGKSWQKAGEKANGANSKLARGLDNLDSKFTKLTGAASKFAVVLGLIAATQKGLTADQTAAEEIDDLYKLYNRSGGESFERFQRQADAARKAKVELTDYSNVLTRLGRKVADAKDGNALMAKSFDALGINIDQFSDMHPEERFAEMAEAYKRTAATMGKDFAEKELTKIMEEEAQKFYAMFAGGREGVLAQERAAVGIVSEDRAKEAAKLLDQQATNAAIRRKNNAESFKALYAKEAIKETGDAAKSLLEKASRFVVDLFKKKEKNAAAEAMEETSKAVDKAYDSNDKYLKKVEEVKEAEAGLGVTGSSGASSVIGRPDSGTPTLMNMRSTSTLNRSSKTPEFRLLDELKALQAKSLKALEKVAAEI